MRFSLQFLVNVVSQIVTVKRERLNCWTLSSSILYVECLWSFVDGWIFEMNESFVESVHEIVVESAGVVSGCCCLPSVVFVVFRVAVVRRSGSPPIRRRIRAKMSSRLATSYWTSPRFTNAKSASTATAADPLDVATIDRTTTGRCSWDSGSP